MGRAPNIVAPCIEVIVYTLKHPFLFLLVGRALNIVAPCIEVIAYALKHPFPFLYES